VVVVAVVALGQFVISVPARYAQLAHPTTGVRAALAEVGLSARGYALYNVGLDTLFVSVFAAAAIVIFWRRSDDMALLVATMLIVWGPLNGLLVLTPSATEGMYPVVQMTLGSLLTYVGYMTWMLFLLPLPKRTLRAALDALVCARLGTFLRFSALHAFGRPAQLAAPALQRGRPGVVGEISTGWMPICSASCERPCSPPMSPCG
jgi:hypothetical protein